jgi:gluconolactonase
MTTELAQRVERILMGVDHAEGVAITPDGWLWCGGEAGQVYRSRLAGPPTVVAELPGHPLGLAVDGHGSAYCCCAGSDAGIYRVTPEGAVSLISRGTSDRPCRAPNYPLFLDDGRLLFTDSGTFGMRDGCIYEVSPGGGTRIADSTCCGYPNGLALAPDGRTIAVVESEPPLVSTLELLPDGSLDGRRVLALLPGTVPDGAAYDEHSNLLVSFWVPDRIVAIAPDGTVETVLADPHRQYLISPTNLAFVSGSDEVVCANYGHQFLSRFRHTCRGGEVARPLNPPSVAPREFGVPGLGSPQEGLDSRWTPTTEAA